MLHIITPVKDSIESTEETLRALAASTLSEAHVFRVYNDFCTEENTARLRELCAELGIELVNLCDLTDHPSPNYLFVLRRERRACLEEGAGLLIVESDVTVRPGTLQSLAEGVRTEENCGMAAAVTVDADGNINYPYEFARKLPYGKVESTKHMSFCCTLLTQRLLQEVDFDALDETKNWFDVTISHESRAKGLKNLLFTSLPVTHRPHQSRPWKQLKYKSPLKYYWRKLTKGLDKI
ncbi:MAG: glycosyltransferase family 2 protein [Alloprevotella sp.]|nr:glycosyltransferase family 2 protein [Alloprevotella sp.]